MHRKVISISLSATMLSLIDEAAAASYQSRSSFIRMAIVEKFGAKSEYELAAYRAPDMHTDKELGGLYDFDEEYEQAMAESNPEEAS